MTRVTTFLCVITTNHCCNNNSTHTATRAVQSMMLTPCKVTFWESTSIEGLGTHHYPNNVRNGLHSNIKGGS